MDEHGAPADGRQIDPKWDRAVRLLKRDYLSNGYGLAVIKRARMPKRAVARHIGLSSGSTSEILRGIRGMGPRPEAISLLRLLDQLDGRRGNRA